MRQPVDYLRLAPGEIYFQVEENVLVQISSDTRRRTLLVSTTENNLEVKANTADYLGRNGVVLTAADSKYCDPDIQSLVGQQIVGIEIMKIDDDDDRSLNQRGIVFHFNGHSSVVVGIDLRGTGPSHLSFMELADIRPGLPIVRAQM